MPEYFSRTRAEYSDHEEFENAFEGVMDYLLGKGYFISSEFPGGKTTLWRPGGKEEFVIFRNDSALTIEAEQSGDVPRKATAILLSGAEYWETVVEKVPVKNRALP